MFITNNENFYQVVKSWNYYTINKLEKWDPNLLTAINVIFAIIYILKYQNALVVRCPLVWSEKSKTKH